MWKIIECAAQGRSHISSETPCQDKTFSYSENGMDIIALADGAGSVKLSHFGAKTVTEFACREIADQFDEYFAQSSAGAAAQQFMSGVNNILEQKARELECDKNDLASTLLLAAVKDDRYILIHLGDGVIGYYKNGEIKTASQPDNGEFANTTVFTTSKSALASIRMLKGTLGEISGFVLMSDGTEASLYDKRKKVPSQALKKVMDMCTYVSSDKIQEHLQYDIENVIRNKTTDDCSLAVLAKVSDEFRGYLALDNREKIGLLEVSPKTRQRTLERYDEILKYLQKESSADELARHLPLDVGYLKRNYLRKLCRLNFIELSGAYYKTILILEI